jgi:hypothetical protein
MPKALRIANWVALVSLSMAVAVVAISHPKNSALATINLLPFASALFFSRPDSPKLGLWAATVLNTLLGVIYLTMVVLACLGKIPLPGLAVGLAIALPCAFNVRSLWRQRAVMA